MSACAQNAEADETYEAFLAMRQKGLKPDALTCSLLIVHACHAALELDTRHAELAFDIFADMKVQI